MTSVGEKINAYVILVEREGKKLLGSSRRGWKCNIQMDCKYKAWESVDCSHVAQAVVDCNHVAQAVVNRRTNH